MLDPDTKKMVTLPVLDGATFIFEYKPPVSILLKQLKYRFGREILPVIGEWAIGELKKRQELPKRAVLIPIPLHNYRYNWRGFNQAEELGRKIAQEFGWEFRNDILVRSKWRPPQTEVKKAQKRAENVRGIFSINPSAQCLMPNHLILFDDVWTTGATIKEAAKVLKENGAKKVWGLTIAR
ncbi:ComF family protein [Candidatus Microgenomates bacterium]|nr:ComF family protein [Candidatus Microgenomates bacterium]